MNKPHLSEAFKPEAVKQGAERSCPVAETACHPSTACLMAETCDCWRAEPAESADLQVEIRHLEAELKRVAEARDILEKQPSHALPSSPARACPDQGWLYPAVGLDWF